MKNYHRATRRSTSYASAKIKNHRCPRQGKQGSKDEPDYAFRGEMESSYRSPRPLLGGFGGGQGGVMRQGEGWVALWRGRGKERKGRLVERLRGNTGSRKDLTNE